VAERCRASFEVRVSELGEASAWGALVGLSLLAAGFVAGYLIGS
jgi:hypothetical protein